MLGSVGCGYGPYGHYFLCGAWRFDALGYVCVDVCEPAGFLVVFTRPSGHNYSPARAPYCYCFRGLPRFLIPFDDCAFGFISGAGLCDSFARSKSLIAPLAFSRYSISSHEAS